MLLHPRIRNKIVYYLQARFKAKLQNFFGDPLIMIHQNNFSHSEGFPFFLR